MNEGYLNDLNKQLTVTVEKVEEIEALTREGNIDEALEATRRILKNIDNQ